MLQIVQDQAKNVAFHNFPQNPPVNSNQATYLHYNIVMELMKGLSSHTKKNHHMVECLGHLDSLLPKEHNM